MFPLSPLRRSDASISGMNNRTATTAAEWLAEDGSNRAVGVGDPSVARADAGEQREEAEDEIDRALDRKPEARERYDNLGRDTHCAECKKPRRSAPATGRRLIDGRASDWLVLVV